LLALTPERFEHLSKRLLREAGFTQVEVTGRSGDEGIDGTGIYRPTLVSFPVFFQCKRYKGSVGASKVRDFRGAMAGRGDQGILITTGTFIAEARAESSRPGAPLVDLIDGEALCDLLKQYQLGVLTTERTVEDVRVLPDFFAQVYCANATWQTLWRDVTVNSSEVAVRAKSLRGVGSPLSAWPSGLRGTDERATVEIGA
jgi:restriction system protein